MKSSVRVISRYSPLEDPASHALKELNNVSGDAARAPYHAQLMLAW